MKKNKILLTAFILLCAILLGSCQFGNDSDSSTLTLKTTIAQLEDLLKDETITEKTRYGVINRMANLYYTNKKYNEMNLFLESWVENHPEDSFNAYWLFMIATDYINKNQEPIAEYYYERILKNCPDLIINSQSVHFACLQKLIQISKNPSNRIFYLNTFINKFPMNVSITEMNYRLALEYEKVGEWKQALKAYESFLKQPDASTIQIVGYPDAYLSARKMVDFNNSPKNWTFESLEALEAAVKKALSSYNGRLLDSYRSKVNFFAISWKADESDSTTQEDFYVSSYMHGNRITFSPTLTDVSSNEAYLRTSGWSSYMNVWYLYFRKVNFPVKPEIHGQWEWAGIYLGDKF
ncbi:tetratricopeptide repeat protein [Treponema zioleckii]|uniref:tetratricopeptide repeat protein n=1 Tax=Treponema zioleckii TaxID=331680 RepID=UPI00168BDEBF|nr:tetratricopeptide repeat protein [Treponema zioleckii]